MPNWVDQQLNIIGPRDDIERFCRLAVVSPPKSDRDSFWPPEFAFTRVCPARPGDEQAAEPDPECGDLFRVVWSHTQANFSIQTARTYPQHFYLTRLLREWPSFSFCCAVYDEMSIGGLIGGFDGVVTDLVLDYDADYNRRSHGRRISALNKRWARLASEGRPFMVRLLHRYVRRAHYDVDATFDRTGLELYLRTEAECRRLLRHRRHATVRRESQRSGSWRKVRALCKGDVRKDL